MKPPFTAEFTTWATITEIEQEEVFEGQIRYTLTLEDVPLEAQEFLKIRNAINALPDKVNRFKVTLEPVGEDD